MKVIATNGYLNIIDIIYSINDYVVLDDGTECQVEYDDLGEYFTLNNTKYSLNDFIRTDI